MEALSSLIRRADAGDPLAAALAAILDSGFVVLTRDGAGRFVQVSEVAGSLLSIGDGRGDVYTRELRYYDSEQRLLPLSELPPQQVRTSGRRRRGELNLLETAGGRVWMQQSNLPLEQTAEGWSVLTIGADVTELVERAESAERAAAVRGALLEVGAVLAGGPVTRTELLELLRKPMAELAANGNVLVAWQEGDEFEMKPVHRGFGTGLTGRRGRLSQLQRDRWQAASAHVNQDVQLTDIYGASVVAELEIPFRSVVIAPSSLPGGSALGALVLTHPEPGAFEAWQIESLELAGRMLARTLHGGSEWAEQRSA